MSEELPDSIVYGACYRYFQKSESATQIAEWVNRELKERGISRGKFARTSVYPILRRAAKLGFLQLIPPHRLDLAKQIANTCAIQAEDVLVLDDGNSPEFDGSSVNEVAFETAKLCLQLSHRIAESHPLGVVNIGWGAGITCSLIAKHLATLLTHKSFTPSSPIKRFRMHALVSGRIHSAKTLENELYHYPSYFFTNFFGCCGEDLPIDVIDFQIDAIVPWDNYSSLKNTIAVQDAENRAKNEIDLIVNSVATHSQKTGLLLRVLNETQDRKTAKATTLRLKESNWVGDIGYHPFSKSGQPIEPDKNGFRAVHAFPSWHDLLRWKNNPGHYLILAAGVSHGFEKTEAIRALMTKDDQHRIFTHLVLDSKTAAGILDLENAIEGGTSVKQLKVA